jgi:pyruvate/2-oxoglutarate dehydrogenase complex dihydrolipoamide dehydrogenase (E3) component
MAVIPPNKEEIRNILEFLTWQVTNLNIEIHLRSEVNEDIIRKDNPDAVILATGAEPVIPEIPGGNIMHIFTPAKALQKDNIMGERIVVIGGGLVGCETAEYLSSNGKQVVIVEKLPEIAMGIESHTKLLLLERLNKLGVKVIIESEVISVQGKTMSLRSKRGETHQIQADEIVIALGSKSDNSLQRKLEALGLLVFVIGDCKEARDIATAIHEGFRVATEI